jgi:hypothetical protein
MGIHLFGNINNPLIIQNGMNGHHNIILNPPDIVVVVINVVSIDVVGMGTVSSGCWWMIPYDIFSSWIRNTINNNVSTQ